MLYLLIMCGMFWKLGIHCVVHIPYSGKFTSVFNFRSVKKLFWGVYSKYLYVSLSLLLSHLEEYSEVEIYDRNSERYCF